MELELESKNHQLYQFSFSISCTDVHKPRIEASSSVFKMVSGDVYVYSHLPQQMLALYKIDNHHSLQQ